MDRSRGSQLAAYGARPMALAVAALLPLLRLAASGQDAPPEPDGYRQDNYRAPTPAGLQGARTGTTAEAETRWPARARVVGDGMAPVPKPKNLPPGTIWRDKPRLNIPGRTWLPDTGYGALAPATEAYLATGLATLSGGDRARPIVIYCQRDCWMSWNAAKRALASGYTNIIWYPEGTDGWQDAGLPLEAAQPVPRPGE